MRGVRAPGSSPLARGLLSRGNFDFLAVRIIPARAGFTAVEDVDGVIPADHPRSRGVYAQMACAWPLPGGSSPLARGLHVPRVERGVRPGIIPARAGFTTSA